MAYQIEKDDNYIAPRKLKEDRSVLLLYLLTIVTCGIYSIIYYISFSFDLDKVASRHDGKKTMNYLFAYLLGIFTFSIVTDIWLYGVTERMENELKRRDINYKFGTSDFWWWGIFGSLILIGPVVYNYKMTKAMNLLCKSYNVEQENFVKRQ